MSPNLLSDVIITSSLRLVDVTILVVNMISRAGVGFRVNAQQLGLTLHKLNYDSK